MGALRGGESREGMVQGKERGVAGNASQHIPGHLQMSVWPVSRLWNGEGHSLTFMQRDVVSV